MKQDKEPAGGQEETIRLAAAAMAKIREHGAAARLTVWDDQRPNDVKPGEG
jgi:hypothetical protein